MLKKINERGNQDLKPFSILIPVYNEEGILESSVKNIIK
jgi:glycosyltransferase involved in cell wall biosynthesis